MNQQHIRTAMLLGSDCQELLSHKHVAIFGIGGVGSFCAEALARAGVGYLTLIDDDIVSESNINRQLIALHSTIGKKKTTVMADRISDINPHCTVTELPIRYTPENRELFFSGSYDYIADAIDSVTSKIDLIQCAIQREIPIISAMGTGNKLDPSRFRITDLSKTSGCPLARVIRRELKQRGIVHHTVLYSEEPALKPQQLEDAPPGKYTVPGSVAWVPSCAGLMLAGHIIQQLISKE